MFYPTEFHKHFSITLGQQVPAAGRRAVYKLLQEREAPELIFPDWWSWQWLDSDKDHGYQGSFPKRASKLRHALSGKWLSEKDQSDLGELVQRYLKAGGQTLWFDFDDKLNWLRGSFGDPGSCFVHKDSNYLRDLRKVKAFAFRRWVPTNIVEVDEECEEGSGNNQVEFVQDGFQGRGRCWVVPTGEMLAVINVYDYDDLALTTYGQALAEYLGQDFRRQENLHTADNVSFYANSYAGILIGPEEQVAKLPRNYRGHILLGQ